MLRRADIREPLSQDRLVELQNAILDPRFHEFTWRHQQNWIGKDLAYRRQVDFVAARPEDLGSLMLITMSNQALNKIDAVVLASLLAFGFVYIHPFMDGNGRIHRYLIHDVLAKAGFTPRGIILPVSAVILTDLDKYITTLEHYSRSLNRLTDFNPETPDFPAKGNDAMYYRYPDFTRQTEFLYWALERTVAHDLQQEIHYLLGFDKAFQTLNTLLDWPPHSLELFIQITYANAFKLSTNKRKSHFHWMKNDEIEQAEKRVQQAFMRDEIEQKKEL
ncbi:MAG: Fic family protein [Pseudomonadota bacterium]